MKWSKHRSKKEGIEAETRLHEAFIIEKFSSPKYYEEGGIKLRLENG